MLEEGAGTGGMSVRVGEAWAMEEEGRGGCCAELLEGGA